jgi:cobalt-zinc-cadmium efflux system protein
MHVHPHHSGEPHAAHEHGDSVSRRVGGALAVTLVLMIVEFIGGWLSNSLALMADAAHMLSDAAALAATWWALWRSRQPATDRRTFGERRTETLAALFNGSLLLLVAGGILHEGWERFREPASVDARLMLVVAMFGLAANLVGVLLLHRHRDESLSLEGAWQHVVGDAAGSVCAVLAAVGILYGGPGWTVVDAIASALVSILILFGAVRLLNRTVAVLMEHAPGDIDVSRVRSVMLETPGVIGVHCLHVWTISTNCRALSAHVTHAAECSPLDLLHQLHVRLGDSFRVEHVTLQLEPPGFDGCSGHDDWCGVE